MDAVCHQAALVGLGVTSPTCPRTRMSTSPAPRCCWKPWAGTAYRGWSSRPRWCLRRGGVRLRGARPGPAVAPGSGRPGRGPLRAALPALRAAAHHGRSPRTRRSTRATPTPRARWRRSTWPSSWARMTSGTAIGLRYHNVYGPRMPATPRTREWPPSSAPAWRTACRRGCSKTAASAATSCMSATWPAPTCWPWRRSTGRRRARAGSAGLGRAGCGAQRRQRRAAHGGRDGQRAGRRVRRHRARGDRRVPPRRRRHIVASPASAARDLGFRAQTSFADGIADSPRPPSASPP